MAYLPHVCMLTNLTVVYMSNLEDKFICNTYLVITCEEAVAGGYVLAYVQKCWVSLSM